MASSGKTEKLGLSLWEAGDKPERLDFRQDNERLEELVASHLFDASQHLTSEEKAWVKRPFYIYEYTGIGTAARAFYYTDPVTSPRFMICYARDDAPYCVRDGEFLIYAAWGTAKYSGTPGLVVGEKTFTVCQQQDGKETDGYRYCLNEAGKKYVAIVIP